MQAIAATPELVAGELLALWRHLVAGSDRTFQCALGELDLGLTQLKALHALDDCAGELSVKELAGAVGLSLPSASRTVDSLLPRGYIERREDEHDRRHKRVRLTAEGRDAVERMHAARLVGLERFVASLPDAHRERLHAALHPLLQDLTESRP